MRTFASVRIRGWVDMTRSAQNYENKFKHCSLNQRQSFSLNIIGIFNGFWLELTMIFFFIHE